MKHQAKNSEFHLRPAELQQLIDSAQSVRDRLIIELFVYTGIRRAELRQIRVCDLDFSRRRLVIRKGKGGKQRIVYLADEVVSHLIDYCFSHSQEFLFTGPKGGAMSLRNINYIVARAAALAGIATPNPRYRNVGPHLLRHSFARNWKRLGGSLESLQKILGHSSLKTTLDSYGSESQSETEENYQALAARLVMRSRA